MLTILSMIIGLFSSTAPDILKIFQDKRDKSHELAMLELQLKQQNTVESYKMDAIGIQAYSDIVQSAQRSQDSMLDKASRWVVDLTASVRPIATYLFVIAFIGFKMAAFFSALNPNLPWQHAVTFTEAMNAIWGEEENAGFWGIIFYWFGDRALAKNRRA